MTDHYIPLHTLRTCCHEIVKRVHPGQIPIALSQPWPKSHGLVVLLERKAQ